IRSASPSLAEFEWRRERDSNPRRAFDPYTLSRGAPSTTRPSLRATAGPSRGAMILKGQDRGKNYAGAVVRRQVRTQRTERVAPAAQTPGLVGLADLHLRMIEL